MQLTEHAEVLSDVDEGRALVGEPERDLSDVPRVFAAPVLVILDHHLLDGGGLVSGDGGQVYERVAVLGDPEIVLNVGKSDLGEFGQH